LLTAKQMQHYLRCTLGIDWPTGSSKTRCVNEILALVSHSHDKLKVAWKTLGKKTTKVQLLAVAGSLGVAAQSSDGKARAMDILRAHDADTLPLTETPGRRKQQFEMIFARLKRRRSHESRSNRKRKKHKNNSDPAASTGQVELQKIKQAVKSTLAVQGFGETLSSIRLLVSDVTGLDCTNVPQYRCCCDEAVSRAIRRKRQADEPQRELPAFQA
jgi:hypothetical protein